MRVSDRLRCFSYGGGVQSTAAMVLAATRRIEFPHFVFANVGDDAENPATIAYIRDVAAPYAAANGIALHTVRKEWRDGREQTLYGHIMREDRMGVQIPVRLSNGAPARRHCTVDYKIKVLDKWQREHGASEDNPAIVGLGISVDEMQRMRTSQEAERVIVYPLVEMRLTRGDCAGIIRAAGLPVPPKSSCWFCPYRTRTEWQRMRHEEPELFGKAIEMERSMSRRMEAQGEGKVTMHSKGMLSQITDDTVQLPLGEPEDSCESGYCMV